MPTFSRQIAVGAAGDTFSPLDSWQYQRPDFPARLDVAVVKDTATDAGVVSLFSGSDLLAEEDEILDGTTIQWPDSFMYNDVVGRNERIGLKIRTTDATGGGNFLLVVKLTPLGRG